MSSKTSYDPAFCLAEHLNYFQDNVAFDITASDFDDIFGNSDATYLQADVSLQPQDLPLAVSSAPYVFIQKIVAVPNPLPFAIKSEAGLAFSPTILASPTCVREVLNEDIIQPCYVESSTALGHDMTTESTRSSPPCTAVSDDEATSTCETEYRSPSPSYSPVSTSNPLKLLPMIVEGAPEFPPNTIETSMAPLAPMPAFAKFEAETATKPSTKKSSRKRKATSEDGPDVRRERNRLHAKKSRERKREFNQCLNESVQALKEENQWLLSVLSKKCELLGEASLPSLELTNDEEFIAALQNPANRVLSDEDLEDLRSYFN